MSDEETQRRDGPEPDPDAQKRMDDLIRKGEAGELSEAELLDLDEEIADFERRLKGAVDDHRMPKDDDFVDLVEDARPAEPTPEELIEARAAELQRRIEEIREESHVGKDAAWDKRVSEVESVAARARTRTETGLAKDSAKIKSDRESSRGLAIGLHAAYTMMGTPVFFFFIGKAIDWKLGGVFWQSWLTLVGAGLGFAVGIWQLNRFQK